MYTAWERSRKYWGVFVRSIHESRLVDGVVQAWDIQGEEPDVGDLIQSACLYCVETEVKTPGDGKWHISNMFGHTKGYDKLLSLWAESAVAVGSKRLLTIGIAYNPIEDFTSSGSE